MTLATLGGVVCLSLLALLAAGELLEADGRPDALRSAPALRPVTTAMAILFVILVLERLVSLALR